MECGQEGRYGLRDPWARPGQPGGQSPGKLCCSEEKKDRQFAWTWGLPRLGFCYKRSPQGPQASSWVMRGTAATGNHVAAGEMEQPGPRSLFPQSRALTTDHFNIEKTASRLGPFPQNSPISPHGKGAVTWWLP